MKHFALFALFMVLTSTLALKPLYASTDASQANEDARLKAFEYHEDKVYEVTGHYGITSLIQFSEYEQIETMSIGDSASWQVTPSSRGNLLFLKPILEQAETNLSVVTNKRIYSFALRSNTAQNLSSQELNFRIKFTYPKGENPSSNITPTMPGANYAPVSYAPLPAEDLNFEYSFAGEKALRPIKMFDDGKFTYLRFDEYIALPAVFAVDPDGTESLVNFNMQGPYMKISGIYKQFTLRSGGSATCVFNDAHPRKTPQISAREEKTALENPKAKKNGWIMASNGYPIPPQKPSRGLFAAIASIF